MMMRAHVVDAQKKKAMRHIIIAQCAGAPGTVFFTNGFLLTYLAAMGISSATVLQLLALPNLLALLVRLPAATISDRVGKKTVGTLGLGATVIGFFLITLAGGLPEGLGKQTVTVGIVVYGIGLAASASNWFALLSPIIPEHLRGRFFGKLRVSWQSTSIFLTLIASALLRQQTSIGRFQVTLILLTLLLAVRVIVYRHIPEIEKPTGSNISIMLSLRKVIVTPNYMPFCSYVFLLSLFTGACPWIFGLLEKDVLAFSQDQIVLMGTLLLLGSLAGFYLGGKMVDRLGTKYVFLVCHFSFSLVLLLFLAREWIRLPLLVIIGLLTACFGLIQAASGIAITSELLGLIPIENKSLATAIATTLQSGALAISGILAAQVIDKGLLADSWLLFGKTMSKYDTMICGFGMIILMLTVTLGLVPSVVTSAQWMPGGGITNAST